ncbi:MAG: hypothetical protein LEGION0398_MBIBDBAK_01217 [Legionellaceae bacterium]
MHRNNGIIIDILFVGPTRPSMIGGVTFLAFMLNMLLVMEFFVITRNLLWLGLFFPIHGLFYLICASEPLTFDLFGLWLKTKGANFKGLHVWGNRQFWQANSYSHLSI